MSELGDLLELLHDAFSQVTTLELEYQSWRRERPSNDVRISASELGKPQLAWQRSGPWPVRELRTRRVWFERPGRLRVEITEDEDLTRLGVRQGPRWWRWDVLEGTSEGVVSADQGPQAIPPLLVLPVRDAQRLLGRMRFEPIGSARRLGREVVCARAYPREQPRNRPALSHEFEFDAEHGTILRRVEFEDGQCVFEREATAVIYNSALEERCFVFEAPDEQDAVEPPATREP